MDQLLQENYYKGDVRALARCITVVENELPGHDSFLRSIKFTKQVPVIGITGPPGAGKSTLINSLINHYTNEGKKVGVVAVDPTSPFNHGSILGDRLRMSAHFNNNLVYIRSLATRGSLGGLSAKAIEVLDVMKGFNFDIIIIETVGVGQSEVEIAGLADVTVLVLVPESGDEVQTIKSGIMEIADVYVVNKSDREGADLFVKNLITLVGSQPEKLNTPVIKTVASENVGVAELASAIANSGKNKSENKKTWLLSEKAYRLIQQKRMKDVSKDDLLKEIEKLIKDPGFNLYNYVDKIS